MDGRREKLLFWSPARIPTSLSSCPPQEEDSFYPPKIENPPHCLLLLSQPKTEFFVESSAVTPQVKYSFLPPKTVSFSCGSFSSFLPLEENFPLEELHRSEFLLRRANHMTWGFRQFQILPQQVSRVKFNCIQKIKLLLF